MQYRKIETNWGLVSLKMQANAKNKYNVDNSGQMQ